MEIKNYSKILFFLLPITFVSMQSALAQDLTKADSINIDKVNAIRKLYREIRNLDQTIKSINFDSLGNTNTDVSSTESDQIINTIENKSIDQINSTSVETRNENFESLNISKDSVLNSSNTDSYPEPSLKTTFWSMWIPIIISIFALMIALFANHIAGESNKLSIQANSLANLANDIYKDELTLTHRPYVWVENHFFVGVENNLIHDPNTVQLIVINSPAILFDEEHYHYAIDKTGTQNDIRKESFSHRILFPTEKTQYTYTLDQEAAKQRNEFLRNGNDLFREVSLKYKMLSKDNKYFYKAKWKFDAKSNSWNLEKSPEAN